MAALTTIAAVGLTALAAGAAAGQVNEARKARKDTTARANAQMAEQDRLNKQADEQAKKDKFASEQAAYSRYQRSGNGRPQSTLMTGQSLGATTPAASAGKTLLGT